MNIIEKLTSDAKLASVIINYLEFLKKEEIKTKHLNDLVRAYATADIILALKSPGEIHKADLFLKISEHLDAEEFKTSEEILKKKFPEWSPMKDSDNPVSKDIDDLLDKITAN